MSNTTTIGESTIQSVGFESVEREEGRGKGFAAEAAAQTHLNGVKDALMEVAKAETQRAQEVTRPKGKNSMITTFKIMKIVMETLQKSSEGSKEANKLLKKEWKALSDKQSENNKASYETVNGNQWYLAGGQILGFSHYILQGAAGMGLDKGLASGFNSIGGHDFRWNQTFTSIGTYLNDAEKVKEGIKGIEKISPQLATAGNSYAQSMTSAEQYNLGIKESIFQHEVQTHTSEYQNGTQQQTSDKQAVDNAADTAKQLIRVQGEILMGKAG